jgi:sugar O-acyltransferase (sialic acid O-acetyltransferase NeuD family)
MKVLIVGAGGHGQVVADILLCAHRAGGIAVPVGYLDDAPGLQGQTRLGLPVLGSLEQIGEIPHDDVILAIGDNCARKSLYEHLEGRGERFATAIHPRSVIASDVQIGPGSMVCAGVVVNPGSVVGANVILNTGCTVDHHNRIGDHVHIAPGAHLGGDVGIGEGTLVGIGATVMPQRRVGDWSVVGAGALVHVDLPDRVVAVGTPARAIRSLATKG